MKLKLAALTLTVLIAAFCFGCGKNEHEVSVGFDDKYGYTGTWIGQTSANTFTVANIFRHDDNEKPYLYDAIIFVYVLTGGNNGQINANGNNVLVWDMVMDTREAEVKKNADSLFFYGGLAGGGGQGIWNVGGGQKAVRDGKKLILSQDGAANSIVLKREDDYDDLLDTFDDLKKKIADDITGLLHKKFPNAKFKITDKTKQPKSVVVE